ncbi:unnamed protein product [Discula destructiva]
MAQPPPPGMMPPGLEDLRTLDAQLRIIQEREAERLQAAEHAEAERQHIINRILQETRVLQERYNDLAADYEGQKVANRQWLQSNMAMQRQIDDLRRSQMEATPLVGVFIDGDGAKFHESLVKLGSEGGEKAAHALQDEIRRELRDLYPGTNTNNWGIMVVVIAAMDSLSYAYHNHLAYNEEFSGVTHWPTAVRSFAVGFNRGAHHTFSFVDIGGGKGLKELTDTKLREMFSMMFPHCKHVFFAGCHDSGYVSFLGPYKHDRNDAEKLTLIETHNTNHHYYSLGFKMTRFPSIFRSEDFPPAPSRMNTSTINTTRAETPVNGRITPPSAYPSRTGSISDQARLASPFGAPSMTTTSQRGITSSDSRAPTPSTAAAAAAAAQNSSWVTVSKNGLPQNKTIDIAPAKKKQKAFYVLNRENERVDLQLPKHTPMAAQSFQARIKEQGQNFCNRCHINGPDNCDQTDQRYRHGKADLAPDEFLVLRTKVRSLPCEYGPQCPDMNCALGHHCRNGRNCTLLTCRFADTHHMDIRPYKKVFEDGTTELY